MNDMYLHHHPNKVSMAAGTPRLAADAGKRLKRRQRVMFPFSHDL